MMSLKMDLKQTLKKNTSKDHVLSDSDSDETIEPDPPDWETAVLAGDAAGITQSSTEKSHNKAHSSKKNIPLKTELSRHSNKTHDLSDSDDDFPKYKSHNMSDSDTDVETSKQVDCVIETHKYQISKIDTKLDKRTSISHDMSDSDDETEDYFKPEKKKSPKIPYRNLSNVSDAKLSRYASTTHNISDSDDDIHNQATESQKHSSNLLGLKRKQTLMLGEEEKGENHASSNKPLCKFGSSCYRKNPSHLKEFFHPRDYISRKNSPDIKEFFHPRKNQPSPSSSEFQPSTSRGIDFSTPPPSKKMKIETDIKGQRSPLDVFEENQPISFFLTKVAGIHKKYNQSHAMNLKDVLSPSMGKLVASCQFNYMFDLPWLLDQYPDEFRRKPLLIVHGIRGGGDSALQATVRKFPNVTFCKAKLSMSFGTHHTKMMFLLYEDGMRVVIHTSNMIHQDWHQKTQGMWISPVFPKLSTPGVAVGDSPTKFKHDLLEYITSYEAYQLKEWKDNICKHDMSSARVFIIASSPGRHLAEKKSCFGHLKLRKVLREFGPRKEDTRGWPVIGQFSSIGTLGYMKDKWLCAEFLQSLVTVKGTSNTPLATVNFQLIFPTIDNVRTSLEGYPAGGSIPYSISVAKKQEYLHTFFHKWKSDGRGRSRAMPHIKTYGRPSPSSNKLGWYLVTSSNLSKAAWGTLEKQCKQLMIRSYEIGVLFIPSFFSGKSSFTATSNTDDIIDNDTFLLPYDLPLVPYQKGDKPWIWDIPHKELPDTNGNMWCPS